METHQRRYPRIGKPLEATWSGASGGSNCRITDISWGGCFIQTPAEPAIGEPTRVSAMINDREVILTGTVVYLERAIGFAVEFDQLQPAQIDVLGDLLGVRPVFSR
jgi:hypothetical protein